MVKKLSIIAAVVAVFTFAYLLWVQVNNVERAVESVPITNDAYGFNFTYLGGPDGYELIESGTSDDFLQSFVLIAKAELADFQAADVETAPPTMSVFVFQQPEEEETEDGERPGRVTRLQNWAQANAGLTSYERIYGTPEIVEVDGVTSLQYTTDGTYQQTVFLVSYRGFIYMFVGQYDRPTDQIKQDFAEFMTEVRFE